jgi:hypothetical protein
LSATRDERLEALGEHERPDDAGERREPAADGHERIEPERDRQLVDADDR